MRSGPWTARVPGTGAGQQSTSPDDDVQFGDPSVAILGPDAFVSAIGPASATSAAATASANVEATAGAEATDAVVNLAVMPSADTAGLTGQADTSLIHLDQFRSD